jgi:hypothetical protein
MQHTYSLQLWWKIYLPYRWQRKSLKARPAPRVLQQIMKMFGSIAGKPTSKLECALLVLSVSNSAWQHCGSLTQTHRWINKKPSWLKTDFQHLSEGFGTAMLSTSPCAWRVLQWMTSCTQRLRCNLEAGSRLRWNVSGKRNLSSKR